MGNTCNCRQSINCCRWFQAPDHYLNTLHMRHLYRAFDESENALVSAIMPRYYSVPCAGDGSSLITCTVNSTHCHKQQELITHKEMQQFCVSASAQVKTRLRLGFNELFQVCAENLQPSCSDIQTYTITLPARVQLYDWLTFQPTDLLKLCNNINNSNNNNR